MRFCTNTIRSTRCPSISRSMSISKNIGSCGAVMLSVRKQFPIMAAHGAFERKVSPKRCPLPDSATPMLLTSRYRIEESRESIPSSNTAASRFSSPPSRVLLESRARVQETSMLHLIAEAGPSATHLAAPLGSPRSSALLSPADSTWPSYVNWPARRESHDKISRRSLVARRPSTSRSSSSMSPCAPVAAAVSDNGPLA